MRTLLLVLFTFLLFGSGSTAAQQITEKANDITGVTRLSSAEMRPLHSPNYPGTHATFRAEYEHDRQDEESWSLSFYGFAEDTTALSTATTVRVNANGQSLEPLRVESRTRQVGETLLEINRAVFTRPAFEQIATAQSLVTATIGPYQFEAIHARREDMRLILDRVPREGPPTASSEDDSSSNSNQ